MADNYLFKRKIYVIAILGFALIGAASEVQTMYSQRDELQILDAPDIAGVPLEIVTINAPLAVLSDSGRWLEVQTNGGTDGWVLGAAMAAEEVSGEGGLTNVLSLASPTLDTAAAGRGVLSGEAQRYASNKNYDPAILDQMFEARIRVRGQWREFVRDGGLARGAGVQGDEE